MVEAVRKAGDGGVYAASQARTHASAGKAKHVRGKNVQGGQGEVTGGGEYYSHRTGQYHHGAAAREAP